MPTCWHLSSEASKKQPEPIRPSRLTGRPDPRNLSWDRSQPHRRRAPKVGSYGKNPFQVPGHRRCGDDSHSNRCRGRRRIRDRRTCDREVGNSPPLGRERQIQISWDRRPHRHTTSRSRDHADRLAQTTRTNVDGEFSSRRSAFSLKARGILQESFSSSFRPSCTGASFFSVC
jgi:hypothetical protein